MIPRQWHGQLATDPSEIGSKSVDDRAEAVIEAGDFDFYPADDVRSEL
jgi:hypothetical protein